MDKTVKDVYFLLKRIKNKYVNDTVIKELLFEANKFETYTEFIQNYESPCKNINLVADWLEKIMDGEPMQYVIAHTHFLGLKIKVSPDVLIPRPETEELVLFAIRNIKNYFPEDQKLAIYDVCTGSGCIALTLKDEFKDRAEVCGSDISSEAIRVARENSRNLKLDVKYATGDMLRPMVMNKEKFDVIVSNPPYIEDINTIDEQVLKYEPHIALLASPITKYYEKIFKNCFKILNERWLMIFEINEDMCEELEKLCKKYFPNYYYQFRRDMTNRWRYLIIKSHNDKDIDFDKINSVLDNHGVIAFPTETVCGLGVSYDDTIAIEKLNKLKGHRESKPYTLMLGDVSEIEKYAEVDERAAKLIKAFMPGDLTLLLKRKNTVPDHVTLGSDVVGIRVSDNPLTSYIIKNYKKPLLVPSANRSDEPPTVKISETKRIFREEIDYYIPGDAGMKKPSTIVSLIDKPKLIRQGDISKEEIEEILGENL